MNIKEASKKLGVGETTLRDWETQFNIKVKRGAQGRPYPSLHPSLIVGVENFKYLFKSS